MSTTPSKLVLYVDDEDTLCRAFARSLRASDMRVITTTSPVAAMELLRTVKFDVVASDLRMPEVTGLDVLRRARDEQPDAQRLLVSGHPERSLPADALSDAGVTGVLGKPWTIEELRAALGIT
jgi:serine/threonine-protein kinase